MFDDSSPVAPRKVGQGSSSCYPSQRRLSVARLMQEGSDLLFVIQAWCWVSEPLARFYSPVRVLGLPGLA